MPCAAGEACSATPLRLSGGKTQRRGDFFLSLFVGARVMAAIMLDLSANPAPR